MSEKNNQRQDLEKHILKLQIQKHLGQLAKHTNLSQSKKELAALVKGTKPSNKTK